jgi:ribosome-binding factor A
VARQRGERVRPERLAEQMRMDAAQILQSQIKDPRLPLVTCTRVSVTNDLKHAKLYVSVLGNEEDQKIAMKVLVGATGYVRRLLSERLGIRFVPEIQFVYDPSVEYGIRLEELIEETRALDQQSAKARGDLGEPMEPADPNDAQDEENPYHDEDEPDGEDA